MKTLYMKILFTVSIIAVLLGCEKPDYITPNDQTDILKVYASVEDEPAKETFSSRIVGDTIFLDVDYYYPINSDNEVDLSKLLLYAQIPQNAKITPALRGFTDLSSPIKVKITGGGGSDKEYIIKANKRGNTDVLSAKLEFDDINGDVVESTAIIIGNDLNFSVVPGTIMRNPRVTYSLNRHAQGSFVNGSTVNLDQPLTFTVTSVGNAKKDYTMKVVEAKKLPRGIREGSAKVMFAKRMKGDLGITTENLASGLALSGKYLVVNIAGQRSIYLDALTGQKVGDVDLSISGVLHNNNVTSDDAGNILVCNYSWGGGDVFKVYKKSSVSGALEPFISAPLFNSFGEKISVAGDITKDAIITSPLVGIGESNWFARWQVKNGVVVSQDPEVVNLSPSYKWNWSNADVIHTSSTDIAASYYVTGYSTNRLAKINGSTNGLLEQNTALDLNFISNSVDYMEFNNAKFVTYNYVNSQPWGSADQVFLLNAESPLVGNPSTGSSLGLIWSPAAGLYGAAAAGGSYNSSGKGDVIMGVSENGYYMYLYFMFTNGYVVGVQFDCVDL
ncbi:DUF5018 domain-containing protein [Arcticibacter sp.]|uniref:DUF5018 domain-containing protein n=1 Tax=Arcticibacter sp. TaxID=1872630 RepID=UPI00388D9E5E